MGSIMSEVQIEHNSKTTNDLLEIISLVQEIRTHMEYPAGFRWDPEDIKDEFKLSNCSVLKHNERVLGFVLFRQLSDAFEITCLGTQKDSMRHGVMSQLLSSIFDHFKDPQEWWLEVHEKNQRAIAFYQKMGFEGVGLRKGYYKDGCSAVLMKLKLASL